MKRLAASALSIVALLALTTLSEDTTLSDDASIQRSVMLSRVSSTKAGRMKIISSEEELQNSDVNTDADVQTSSLGETKGVRSNGRSRESEGRGRRAQNQDDQKDFLAVPDSGKLKDAWWYKEYMDHSVPNTQNMRWSSAFAPGMSHFFQLTAIFFNCLFSNSNKAVSFIYCLQRARPRELAQHTRSIFLRRR